MLFMLKSCIWQLTHLSKFEKLFRIKGDVMASKYVYQFFSDINKECMNKINCLVKKRLLEIPSISETNPVFGK